MVTYIIRRLLQGLVVMFLVSFFTFALMHLAPGSPVDLMLGEAGRVTDEQIAEIEARWGLDRPFHEQYLTWLGNVLRGDLGTSVVRRGFPVTEMVGEAAWVTIQLNAMAVLLAVGVSLPVGLLAANWRYSRFDYASMVGATLGVALPNFWLALMLIILFTAWLDVLPGSGWGSWEQMILPVLVMAVENTAIFARMMRSSTIEIMSQDFVQVARAKGLSEAPVVMRHVFRNSLLPVISVIGWRIAFILSGTIVVETVFGVPGLGQLFITSVDRLDYQVMQGIVLLFAVVVVLGNLITDLAYAYIDPRIRLS